MLRYRWFRLLIVLATVGIGSLQEARTGETRILPNQVTVSNVEAFKEQMRRDLPVGTAKASVEEYLTRWKIPYDFFGPAYGPSFGNTFQGRFPDIGYRLGIFPVDLNFRIYFDSDDKVREIFFQVYTDTP
jgi:hypothetical protein